MSFDSLSLKWKASPSVLVLVIDNDAETRNSLSRSIQKLGHNCQTESLGEEALLSLETSHPDVVMLDLLLPDFDYRHLAQSIQKNLPDVKLVALARKGANSGVRDALNWGAHDFLRKPVDELRLDCVLSHLFKGCKAKNSVDCIPEAFFNSDADAFDAARKKFKRAVQFGIPVLVEGAPGTGKATLARHLLSAMAPEYRVWEYDATTSDHSNFLEIIRETQSKSPTSKCCILILHLEATCSDEQEEIIKLMQQSKYAFMATTRGRLMDHAEKGLIHRELHNRMSTAPLWLAPMDERPYDISKIGQHFIDVSNQMFGTRISDVNVTSSGHSQLSSFPDNFLGLKKAIFLAATTLKTKFTNTLELSTTAGPEGVVHEKQDSYAMAPLVDGEGNLRPIEELEADAIRFALAHFQGRIGRVAKSLKLGRTTLYRKLLKLNLSLEDGAKNAEQCVTFVQKHQAQQGHSLKTIKERAA